MTTHAMEQLFKTRARPTETSIVSRMGHAGALRQGSLQSRLYCKMGSTESLPTGLTSLPVIGNADDAETERRSGMDHKGAMTAEVNPENRWGETPSSPFQNPEGATATEE